MAVWVGDVSLTLSAPTHCVGPTPVGALSHGPGLDGNDPLPRHTSRVVYYLGNGRLSLVLGDDHSLMGGSDDMKSGVCTSGVWVDVTDFIFMFLGLDWVCTLWDISVHYIR